MGRSCPGGWDSAYASRPGTGGHPHSARRLIRLVHRDPHKGEVRLSSPDLLSLNEPQNMFPDALGQRGPGADDLFQVSVHAPCAISMHTRVLFMYRRCSVGWCVGIGYRLAMHGMGDLSITMYG